MEGMLPALMGIYLQNAVMTPLQTMQIVHETMREAQKIMVQDALSEMRHRNEIAKMVNDTLRAVRSMHFDSMKKQMQYQEKIAKQMANALGKTW